MKKHSQESRFHVDYTMFSSKMGAVVLGCLFIAGAVGLSQVANTYAAGAFDQNIVKPLEAFFSNQTPQQKGLFIPDNQEMEFAKPKPTITPTKTPPPSPTPTTTPTPTKAPVQIIRQPIPSPTAIVTTPSAYSFQSYEEARQKQDEWFKKVQEENRKKSEESKKALEKFREESLKKFEEFKNQTKIQ